MRPVTKQILTLINVFVAKDMARSSDNGLHLLHNLKGRKNILKTIVTTLSIKMSGLQWKHVIFVKKFVSFVHSVYIYMSC